MTEPPVPSQEPTARLSSVAAHSALVSVAPVGGMALALRVVRHPLAIFLACPRRAMILALLLLLPLHLLGHFLRRFLRLFSHLHSVLSEVIYIRLTTTQ